MMKLLWIGSSILLFLGKCVNGFLLYNETEISFTDSHGVAGATPINKSSSVHLTLIQGAAAKGAVCLDGTLPGYHLDPGHGTGAHNWLIQLEGGGWCNNVRSCVFRKTTPRGSSTFMDKELLFTGILSKYPADNPDFYSWNRVKLRYCDGASFLGDSKIKRAQLQFRGQRIWMAAMDELMSKGMRFAKQALLSGCSAGGLASIMHCDEFQGLFPSTTRVKCLSDAGLFLDAADVSGNHFIRSFFGGVATLQRAGKNLPTACTDHLDPTLCFFPQNVITEIQTPLFILNSAYDTWQIVESLTRPSADPRGDWKYCRYNHSTCSQSQIEFLQQFRHQMLNAIENFSKFTKNGLFINSCFAHCQTEIQDSWFSHDSPSVGKKAIAVAVGDWYFERAAVKAIDCAYPCDNTCNHFGPRRN